MRSSTCLLTAVLIMPRCCQSVPLLERIAAKVSEPHACRAAAASQTAAGIRMHAWTHGPETCVFYLLARHSTGAVAEQGPFLGASTLAFAAGMRDAEQAGNPARTFLTMDAFPLRANADIFSYPHYWKYETYTRTDGSNVSGYALYINNERTSANNQLMDEREYNKAVAPYVSGAGGQLGTLVSNLAAAGLLRFVTVTLATSFPAVTPFEVIFSDSVHNALELERALPHMLNVSTAAHHARSGGLGNLELIWRGGGGEAACTTLAFHDVAQDMVWPGMTSSITLLPVGLKAECRVFRGGEPVNCLHKAIDAKLVARGYTVVARMTAGRVYMVSVRKGGG